MLEGTPIEAFVNSSREVIPWFESIRTSDTASADLSIIAIVIAFIIFGLQVRADRKMKKLIEQIESYTKKREEIEAARKKYYVNSLLRILKNIKEQNSRVKEIITDFNSNHKPPTGFSWVELNDIKRDMQHLCEDAELTLIYLADLLTNLEMLEEITSSVPMWYYPIEDLTAGQYWDVSPERVVRAEKTLNEYMPEIDGYIEFLSKKVTDVTNPTP